jgi:hypothetical protein
MALEPSRHRLQYGPLLSDDLGHVVVFRCELERDRRSEVLVGVKINAELERQTGVDTRRPVVSVTLPEAQDDALITSPARKDYATTYQDPQKSPGLTGQNSL